MYAQKCTHKNIMMMQSLHKDLTSSCESKLYCVSSNGKCTKSPVFTDSLTKGKCKLRPEIRIINTYLQAALLVMVDGDFLVLLI